jgi:hypothetical protein
MRWNALSSTRCLINCGCAACYISGSGDNLDIVFGRSRSARLSTLQRFNALTAATASPKGNFSPEEQLLLHAYSHNPLGRFYPKDQGSSPTGKRIFLRTSPRRSRSRRWNGYAYETSAYDYQRSLLSRRQARLFRLFLTGINPQIARHRGCDQTRSRSRGHCAITPG